jgi:hypothetical protein
MRTLPLCLLALLAACSTIVPPGTGPQQLFMERLSALCGQAFEGRVVTTDAADREMATNRLVMHVRECSDGVIRIPFHVGDDRSRTWVISRTGAGLRLKHDHRHRDGSEDPVTQYGGDTAGPGFARRQEFPVDAYSRDLFVRENLPASITNVWAMELVPGRTFTYELRRPNRHLRVEFDLTRPVAAPPPPWGSR